MKFNEAIAMIRAELVDTGKADWQIEKVLKMAAEMFLRQSCLVPENEINQKSLDEFLIELSDDEVERIRSSARICLLAMR